MAELTISRGESLFLVPFNVFYYFGFVPFRTRYNEETNGYQLETCSVQKIICAFLSFFAIIFQIYIVVQCYLQFKRDSGTNIVALFETVANFTYFIASLLVIFQVWTKQQDYLQFLERSRCKREPAKFGTFHLYIGLVLFCVVSIVLLWILANDSGHYIREITNNFYNSTSTPEENVTSYGNDTSFRFYFNKVVFSGYTLVQMHTATFSILAQWIFIVLTLVLRRIGEDFRRELETTKHEVGIEKGILLYRNLKETINFTREMYGDFILMFYISSVTYFAETPHILMGRRGNTEIVIVIFSIIINLVWMWAAEFHYQVHNAISNWITFHSDRDSSVNLEGRFKLLSMRSEISTEPIALSCKCFSITYKHLCSMLSLVITYGVIVVQLNSD